MSRANGFSFQAPSILGIDSRRRFTDERRFAEACSCRTVYRDVAQDRFRGPLRTSFTSCNWPARCSAIPGHEAEQPLGFLDQRSSVSMRGAERTFGRIDGGVGFAY
jgi:hypothetical protein